MARLECRFKCCNFSELILDQVFIPFHSEREEQPCIKSGDTSFRLEEEVDYHYMSTLINAMRRMLVKWKRIQKHQNGGDKKPSISILMLNELHVLLHIST